MTRRNPISISIPAHCDQEWDEMTPRGEGRFCTSCQKTVTDFTAMTDAQIIAIFDKAGDNLPCGKFHVSQLDRELIAPMKPKFSQLLVKRIAATVILFQSFISLGRAQTAQVKPATEAGPQSKKGPWPVPSAIKGKVISRESGQAWAGITVTIRGTAIKAFTDPSGQFSLPLTDSLPGTVFLVVSASHRALIVSPMEIDITGRTETDNIILYAETKKIIDQRKGGPVRMGIPPRHPPTINPPKKNK